MLVMVVRRRKHERVICQKKVCIAGNEAQTPNTPCKLASGVCHPTESPIYKVSPLHLTTILT
jgi:hypothetical protein